MQIPEKVGSKYRFIVLAGQRVAQLQKGAKPRLTMKKKMKLTKVAVEELAGEMIEFTRRTEDGEIISPESSEAVEA